MNPIRPSATYRLQFGPAQLDLAAATGLVAYLHRLGISHLYASPLLRSRPGSTHGYDMVDPTVLDPELGGEPELAGLVAELRRHSMGLILDIVPNHMAVDRNNRWWMEVLAEGPAARHARHFDLFWDGEELPLPVLGRPYAEALAAGELRLIQENDSVVVAYWDDRFPLSASTIDAFGIATAGSPAATIAGINADHELLHRLLDAQHYRLVWWQMSRERLAHRRFFTVTDLVGIRQEDAIVFEDTHRLILALVDEGLVDGLRIDHIDGLRDPAGYIGTLRRCTGESIYIVAEKILGPHESLPRDWAIEGTTGYDYLGVNAQLFLDQHGYEVLSGHYRSFTGNSLDFASIVQSQQRFIIHERLGPETARFAAALEQLARRDLRARDVLPSELIDTAVEVLAALPVYRTYVDEGGASAADRAAVESAVATARAASPDRDPRIFEFLSELLLADGGPELANDERTERMRFVADVQQFTGAVMAKGVEDTAFYQHNLLISLNEVGAHPGVLVEDPVAGFHTHNQATARSHPYSMTTASTHDTKRSEDVRARISAIGQMADRWTAQVDLWHSRNRRHRTGPSAPTRNEELAIYQTLVGAWPLEPDPAFGRRLETYLVKAAREAKVHTAWLDPVEEHEAELTEFASALLDDEEFVSDFEDFAAPLWRTGAMDSLAQIALRLFAPGVPDTYQGQELWDLSLTDPDNRRPIDWDRRRGLLDELDHRHGEPGFIDELIDAWVDGRIKMAVTRAGLHARRRHPWLFTTGDYLPIEAKGARAEHTIAFARRHQDAWALAIVPRLTMKLTTEGIWAREGWEDTWVALPDGAPVTWTDVLTGEEIDAGDGLGLGAVFSRSPVGLLIGGGTT